MFWKRLAEAILTSLYVNFVFDATIGMRVLFKINYIILIEFTIYTSNSDLLLIRALIFGKKLNGKQLMEK